MTEETNEAVVTHENNQSESIANLAQALSIAQGEMGGAVKGSENEYFHNKYADLASVWAAIREPMSKNGLAVIQTTEPDADSVVVVTTLTHKSGEWIRGKLKMTPERKGPQAVGICMSYARRYALAAICGVYQKDDDGEGAEDRDKGNSKKKSNGSKPDDMEGMVDVQRKSIADTLKEKKGNSKSAQLSLLRIWAKRAGMDPSKINGVDDLSLDQCQEILGAYNTESDVPF